MWDVDDLRAFDDRRHIDEFEGDEDYGNDGNEYEEEIAEDYYEDEREEERLGLIWLFLSFCSWVCKQRVQNMVFRICSRK